MAESRDEVLEQRRQLRGLLAAYFDPAIGPDYVKRLAHEILVDHRFDAIDGMGAITASLLRPLPDAMATVHRSHDVRKADDEQQRLTDAIMVPYISAPRGTRRVPDREQLNEAVFVAGERSGPDTLLDLMQLAAVAVMELADMTGETASTILSELARIDEGLAAGEGPQRTA